MVERHPARSCSKRVDGCCRIEVAFESSTGDTWLAVDRCLRQVTGFSEELRGLMMFLICLWLVLQQARSVSGSKSWRFS